MALLLLLVSITILLIHLVTDLYMPGILLAWLRDAEMRAMACCVQEAPLPGRGTHILVAG